MVRGLAAMASRMVSSCGAGSAKGRSLSSDSTSPAFLAQSGGQKLGNAVPALFVSALCPKPTLTTTTLAFRARAETSAPPSKASALVGEARRTPG